MNALNSCLLASFMTTACLADTWTVDDDGPADFSTIQAAIDMAHSGDTILVFPGTYRVDVKTSMPVADFKGKSLQIISRDGPDVTIIDGMERMSPIVIANTIEPDIPHKVEGFTIRNGQAGGIAVMGDCVLKVGFSVLENCRDAAIWTHSRVVLTVAHCTIRNNDSTYLSGGIVTDGGPVLLLNTYFAGNYSDTLGGALRLWGEVGVMDTADIIECTFEQNEASQGAAISAYYMQVNVRDSSFLANTGGQGTVAYLNSQSIMTVENSYFCAHDPDDIHGEWIDLGDNLFEPTCAGDCPGDLNDDGVVNGADLTILLSEWGICAGCPGDIDGNGEVNGADLTILLGNWGSC